MNLKEMVREDKKRLKEIANEIRKLLKSKNINASVRTKSIDTIKIYIDENNYINNKEFIDNILLKYNKYKTCDFSGDYLYNEIAVLLYRNTIN